MTTLPGPIVLPPDPFWLLRVKVLKDGDQIPFQLWMLWHWQFQVAKVIA